MGVLVIDSEDKYSQTELGPPVVFPRLIGSSLASQSIPFQKFIWCPRFGEVHSKYSCEVTRSWIGDNKYLFLYTNECKGIDIHKNTSNTTAGFPVFWRLCIATCEQDAITLGNNRCVTFLSSFCFVDPSKSSAADSLYILDLHGNLTEYVLEPHGVKTTLKSDDTPLELTTTSRAQWTLTR